MTPAITLWLAFVLAVGAVTWFGTRRQAIAFTVISIATAPAVLLTLGHPSTLSPPAQATVLGARIDVDKAIYVLLDGPIPKYYVLPYSTGAANQLKAAMDGAADGQGSVSMRIGEDGSPGFAEEVPPATPEKRAERAMLGG